MLGRGMMAGGNGPKFIGYNVQTGNLGTVALGWPVGTNAGHLAVFYGENNGSSLAPSTSGWNALTSGGAGGSLLWKVLTAADLSATVTMPSGGCSAMVWVFQGPRTATDKGNASNPTYTAPDYLTVAGFTKAPNCLGFFAFMIADAAPARTLASPSLANKALTPATPLGVTRLFQGWYDFVPSDYTNGTAWQINLNTSGWNQDSMTVLEFT